MTSNIFFRLYLTDFSGSVGICFKILNLYYKSGPKLIQLKIHRTAKSNVLRYQFSNPLHKPKMVLALSKEHIY